MSPAESSERIVGAPSRPVSTTERLVGIDLRSLALFRIVLAAILLYDLFDRSRTLTAHYTDQGVLPTWAVSEWLGVQALATVHSYSGSLGFQVALFVLAAIFALAMLVGYRTRLATIVSWILLTSLQARNPVIGHGGDNLLRVLMFWAMFLPLGACWSIDAAPERRRPRIAVSAATFAIQLQVCLMYWVTAALKWEPSWLEGRAIEMALSLDHLTTSFGEALLAWPDLLYALTLLTLWLEIVGPILVWSPIWTGPIRFAVVLTFVGFHLVGLAPTLELGIFPWVCLAAWLVFLPGWMWDRLEAGRPRLFRAIRSGFARLGSRWPLPIPTPEQSLGRRFPVLRTLASILILACLLVVLAGNLAVLDEERFGSLRPSWLGPINRLSGLGQNWLMFAPPPADDGWWVMPGTTIGGREFDVWTGKPVSWRKPANVVELYRQKRWIKYFENLTDKKFLYHRPLFGEYVCRLWNGQLPESDRLEEFQMVFMVERFDAPGEAPRPLLLWGQRCDET